MECIEKGKAHQPYEFGVKVSLAVTHKEGFVVGIQACPENPYDGHTLDGQLDQVERMTGKIPAQTFVGKGYKGHGVSAERSQVLISGTRKLGCQVTSETDPLATRNLTPLTRRRADGKGETGFWSSKAGDLDAWGERGGADIRFERVGLGDEADRAGGRYCAKHGPSLASGGT